MLPACIAYLLWSGSPLSPTRLVELANERGPLNVLVSDGNHDIQNFRFLPVLALLPGNQSTARPSFCHRQAASEGGRSSLSACSDSAISGILLIRGQFFTLRAERGRIFLVPHEGASCDFRSRERRAIKSANGLPDYYKPYISGNPQYVELALFADNSMHKKYGDKAADRLKSIAVHVDSLYSPLKVYVKLVYHEIWTDEDKIEIVESGDRTLDKFLMYRKSMLGENPHDNAHLLTTVKFEQGVVGKAFRGTMCSIDYSGGVDMDHNEDAALVAATVAHEMGHNFGMGHDPTDGDACQCKNQHCLMHPTAGYHYPAYWSECSLRQLFNALERGVDFCLRNQPGTTVSDPDRCGNGVVDPGEECDCGAEVCPHDCCNGATCKLVGAAECAGGGCCDLATCKRKSRATLCRSSTDICDLPEYCNGETDECPPNFFMQDGAFCPKSNNGYCFNGQCGSRETQCKKLWGDNSRDGHAKCYEQNLLGYYQGNCGTIAHGNYTRCPRGNEQCGRLQCETMSERPIWGDATTVTHGFSTVNVAGKSHMCHVIDTQYRDKNAEPGLVNDGAVCGDRKICLSKKCTPLEKIQRTTTDCENNCFNRGVCNNVGNCHCDIGYGGVACDIPGFGGSVNSNPAALSRGISTLVLAGVILFTFAAVFTGISVYYHRKKNVWLPGICWSWTKEKLKLRGVLVPVRKAPAPPGGHRRMKKESLNAAWGDTHVVTYRTADNTLPLFPVPSQTMLPMQSPAETTHDVPVMGMGFPAQAVISPNRSGATVTRSGSLRPRDPPPHLPGRPRNSTITALHAERADELGLNANSGPQELEYPAEDPPDPTPPRLPTKLPTVGSRIERSESMNRPEQPPPPPPPHIGKPKLAKASKPQLPAKPPVSGRREEEEDSHSLSVSDIRAKFDKK